MLATSTPLYAQIDSVPYNFSTVHGSTVDIGKTMEERVREEFADIPVMIEIARCESGFRQFNENGEVLRGVVNSKDVGVAQINEFYHLEASKRLGYDIYTLEGNMGYARWLYEKQGDKPWVHSKFCWSK